MCSMGSPSLAARLHFYPLNFKRMGPLSPLLDYQLLRIMKSSENWKTSRLAGPVRLRVVCLVSAVPRPFLTGKDQLLHYRVQAGGKLRLRLEPRRRRPCGRTRPFHNESRIRLPVLLVTSFLLTIALKTTYSHNSHH